MAHSPWIDLPDWRDASAYVALAGAPRSAFAWEWLRRNAAYRAAASLHRPVIWRYANVEVARAHPAAIHWGLHAFAEPELGFFQAHPVWTAQSHPFVLSAAAEAASWDPPDLFAIEAIQVPETIIRGPGRSEHLLISAGAGEVRLDVVEGSLFTGAVLLRYRLAGFQRAEGPLLVLRRLLALSRTGQVPTSLASAEQRAARLILLLRAFDADLAGASQRDIAASLLNRDASQPRWRTEDPSLRSRAQRLVATARRLPLEYRDLLR
jgi:hypothetical protein